jgi:hypothetical protein
MSFMSFPSFFHLPLVYARASRTDRSRRNSLRGLRTSSEWCNYPKTSEGILARPVRTVLCLHKQPMLVKSS